MAKVWISSLLGACLLLACYPAERGKLLETRLDRLTADNEELTRQLKDSQARLSATLPKLDEKIAQVTQALDGLDKASRRSGADTGIQLQKTIEDVAQLRGQVETYLYRITELDTGIKKLTDETDKKGAGDSDAKRRADEVTRPSDPKEFLTLADQKAKSGDQAVARQLYGEFLKKWPKNEAVPQAHLGLGQAFASDDKCPEALYEFGQVATKFPKSRSAPQALLSSSDCFKKTKDPQGAKAALEEIVSSYPKSDAAKVAKSRLAEMERHPTSKKGHK